MRPLEIYLHIPFCVKKCNYCDFLSAPAGDGERQRYVESLCGKIRSHTETAKAYRVVSVFVGGGTPSLLEGGQIREIFRALNDTFVVEENAEITLEANPGTLTQEKLFAYREAGINRLSIGLQSADDEELRTLGRIHTYGEFLESYRLTREAGFRNINVDLMSAVPGQTPESWERTLRRTAELGPEHISAYSLIIEEGTPFYELYGSAETAADGREEKPFPNADGREEKPLSAVVRREIKPLPDEDTEREMYYMTKRILAQYGYHRYEISNYAKEGFACRHNLGYWERTEYLGIGAGAASFMDHCRWTEGEKPVRLSREEEMSEFMFLGLRKAEGISEARFREEFGISVEERYGEVIRDMSGKGLLERQNGFVRLTERGIDVSNYVMCEFV